MSVGALFVTALAGVIAWLRYRSRRKPERALVVGAATTASSFVVSLFCLHV